MQTPSGWHSRGYLPHFDGGEIFQFVTFRLADAVPARMIGKWKYELNHQAESERKSEMRKKIEAFLDRGYGSCYLKQERIANIVRLKILEFHQKHYDLIAWVIMPNHVHMLFKALPGRELEKILKNIKGSTAREANKILFRKGRFWQKEYFDRYIRDAGHYHSVVAYIENNPVKAGLCRSKEAWWYSSAVGKNSLEDAQ
jgi:REP element-mobilizing transposase RayT